MKTTTTKTLEDDSVRAAVRARYGTIAERGEPAAADCGCTSTGCCEGNPASETYGERLGYAAADLAAIPVGANLNLGCGNPFAIASIKRGETVLDLGSGAGFDAFLAARQLDGTGRVIGVDMTPVMISKARENAEQAGLHNVEFRLGEIEHLPVSDASVDLIISNCVINLSPDKPQVFRETFRVLKRGGRLALSDIVAHAPRPDDLRHDTHRYTGCVAGAAMVHELRVMLAEAGFGGIKITKKTESRELINDWTEGGNAGNFVTSAIIEAVKP